MKKRALVTGASGVIGAAIARELARKELHVLLHYRSESERARRICDDIKQSGGSAETKCFDVTDSLATRRAIGEILEDGPIQVLVSNAGTHDDAPMAGMTTEQWNRVIDVSLNGFFHVTQPLLLPMMRTRWGRVIAISSISGVLGNRGQTNYAAAKAGLHGAVKSLARESASRGVTVNAVAPGLIESSMSAGAFSEDQVKTLIPMKRVGTPEEVAYLVSFLASEEAGYISGQIIGINGGMA
jgi:3-oxoacyl-[acyl-carrier protein] reductase